MTPVCVCGAGLAGCEAAYQAAERGVPVTLCEMKPGRRTPAHSSGLFAELVCSNSLRSDSVSTAVGLLKEELSRMGSLIMEAARATRIPAGEALAVDRVRFSQFVTDRILGHPLIETREVEATEAPEAGAATVIATGPLTSEPLAEWIRANVAGEGLHFFDAVAPIVEGDEESVDRSVVFAASRRGRGGADYLNCPMTRDEYDVFRRELAGAEEAKLRAFDQEPPGDPRVFEGCLPIEVLARRGYDAMRYGPLKPVGLTDPRTGTRPFAVVQLRREDLEGRMYNLVGFQTRLTFPEQRRVFRLIPGLANARFLRYGVMHRNTYLPSPSLLGADYATRDRPWLLFAGQMTGVEGYVESAGSGFVAGVNAARRALGLPPLVFPAETMIGAMARYVSRGGGGAFTPMNANFGLLPPPDRPVAGGRPGRCAFYAARSLERIDALAAGELRKGKGSPGEADPDR